MGHVDNKETDELYFYFKANMQKYDIYILMS